MHLGDRPGPAAERILEALPVDPVADPIRQIADHTGVVYVADSGMVQTAECLCLSEEPASGCGIQIHSEADPPLQ
jgi:hypothetical protein